MRAGGLFIHSMQTNLETDSRANKWTVRFACILHMHVCIEGVMREKVTTFLDTAYLPCISTYTIM